MIAKKLRTEYLKNPIGIDIIKPRFFWQVDGGITQTAYQIQAYVGDACYWDTGKIMSSEMTHIIYEGKLLGSRDQVLWRVRLWDEHDSISEWSQANFEIGLLNPTDWQSKWITGSYKPAKNTRYPIDCFLKKFQIEKPTEKARLYITACGLYEATLDGAKIGEFCLAPGMTDYRHRLQYQTYDVTKQLKKGSNALEIQLADGWYRGSIGCFGPTNIFGRQTKLMCQLEILYEDGTKEMILSDETWRWSNDGAYLFADLKDGEIYDARKNPTYSQKAKLIREDIIPTASNNVIPKKQEIFTPRMIKSPSGKVILDFGQNLAGFIRFRVKGESGQVLNLKLGEILDEDGEFTQSNFQKLKPSKEYTKLTSVMVITGNEQKIKQPLVLTPKQEIKFICSGNVDIYETKFAIFGFRYALVESELGINPKDFEAIAVYSDMEVTGAFSCSNPEINKLYQNTLWSMKSNFLDVPTDCPTRERLGWTGDGQIFFDTASYYMNIASFMRKWLYDFSDNQFKDGRISAVIPYTGLDMVYKSTGASVGWADAVVLIPYRYWKRYGDDQLITQFYPMMRKYAMFMIKNTGHRDKKVAKQNPHNKYVYEKGMHLGEWLEPADVRDLEQGNKIARPEECTAYLHYSMKHMSEIAKFLDKKADYELFNEYAQGAITAYNHLFVEDKTIKTNRQAKLVRPLALGLIEGETRKNVQGQLVVAVEKRNYCIGTGFLSTPFILTTLTNAGRLDIAYKMLENTIAPSWLSQVKAGATTVWEDWDGKESHNHYSPGSVCGWLFDTVCGIRLTGKREFLIIPKPSGTLKKAEATYESIYGEVHSSWEKSEKKVVYQIQIPPNTVASIELPDGKTYQVVSGRHKFSHQI